jgi:HD-GYP domain-containing protein (c-di-GMP phosphodiesterase class II)
MAKNVEHREDIQNFQWLLSEAVKSITHRGINLIAEDPKRFMQMHELPFTCYIPELVEDLRTPLYAKTLGAAKNLFGVKAREANPKQLKTLRGLFRQCIDNTATVNHFPSPIDGHACRTARIAVMIGKELGLSKPELYELFWGGLLHDVGKLFTNELEAVLEAQRIEYDMILPLVRTHASLGGLLLDSVNPLFPIGMICAYQHQESVDGTGYQGLRYEQITTEGRIVGLADGYDATVTRSAWNVSQVRDECCQQYTRAGHPDDAVLLAFLRTVERFHTRWYLCQQNNFVEEKKQSG